MALKKYLKQVSEIFDTKRRKCDKEKHCLRVALKKLKNRKQELDSKLEQAQEKQEREELQQQLKVVCAQRHKGLKLLKELKKK